MKKLLHVSLVAAIVALISFSSCSKGSKGDTGPAGPAGPDSVFYSAWATLNAQGGLDQQGDSLYQEGISASVITQDILDKGVVLTYVGVGSGSTVTDIEPADNYLETDIEVGGIYLFSTSNFTNEFEFRYVVIPGTILANDAAFKGLTPGQIKKMPYADLNTALGKILTPRSN